MIVPTSLLTANLGYVGVLRICHDFIVTRPSYRTITQVLTKKKNRYKIKTVVLNVL